MKTRDIKSNRIKISLLISLLLIISLLAIFIRVNKKEQPSNILGTINGEEITVEEFNLFLQESVSETYTYIYTKYNVEDSSGFWTNSYEGEIPEQIAKEKAIDNVLKYKTEQILMKEEGIVSDISYTDFLKRFEGENKIRAEKLEKKEIIYGPKQFKLRDYFKYLHGGRLQLLIDALKESELEVTEDEIRAYYDKIKDVYFEEPNTRKMTRIVVEYGEDKPYNQQEANAVAEKIWNELNMGKTLEEIDQKQLENMILVESVYGQDKASIYNNVNEQRKEAYVTDIEAKNGKYSFILCGEEIQGGYQPYDKMKETAKSLLIQQLLDKRIADEIYSGRISINNKVLDTIIVN